MLLKKRPISLPMICIAIGFIVAVSPLHPLVDLNPLENLYLTQRLTEFVLVVALMGAGLKLDRPLSWRGWESSWRLIGIAMPLTIVGIAFAGWLVLGLSVPAALLLGAALAPTDPVLASDVQVGPPQSGQEDEVRFALTSEAGLNDGAAFPFVFLAIAIALSQVSAEPVFAKWFLIDVALESLCRSGHRMAGRKGYGPSNISTAGPLQTLRNSRWFCGTRHHLLGIWFDRTFAWVRLPCGLHGGSRLSVSRAPSSLPQKSA